MNRYSGPDPLLEQIRTADPARLASVTGTNVGTVRRWQQSDDLDDLAGHVRRAIEAELARPPKRRHR